MICHCPAGAQANSVLGESSAIFHDAPDDASWTHQSQGSLYYSATGMQRTSLRSSRLESEAVFHSTMSSVSHVSAPHPCPKPRVI